MDWGLARFDNEEHPLLRKDRLCARWQPIGSSLAIISFTVQNTLSSGVLLDLDLQLLPPFPLVRNVSAASVRAPSCVVIRRVLSIIPFPFRLLFAEPHSYEPIFLPLLMFLEIFRRMQWAIIRGEPSQLPVPILGFSRRLLNLGSDAVPVVRVCSGMGAN